MNLTNNDIALAQSGQKILSVTSKAKLVVNNQDVELSPSVTKILVKTLSYIALGKTVVVTTEPAEFSTQQAADFLRVSRPFLVKLLETNEMPYRKVGKHRRVRFDDLTAYKKSIDEKRLKVLAKIAEQAQALNLGY
jgi:excisionase family DNA binding protein